MRRAKGFTMLELVISMAVAGVISLTIALIFRTGMRVYVDLNRSAVISSEAEKAFSGYGSKRSVLWEIRVSSAAATIDPSILTLIMPDRSTVQYSVSNNELLRVSGESREVIAQNVEYVNFNYYGKNVDGGLSPAANSGDAELISVTALINKQGRAVSFYSSARLNNKK